MVVVFTIALVSSFVGIIYTVTSANARLSYRVTNRFAAQAYADGVLESLYDQWRNAMITVTNTTDRTDGLSTAALASVLTIPNSTTLPLPPNVSLSGSPGWSVVAATPLLTTTTRADGRPEPENGTNSTLRTRLNYIATVNLSFAGPTGQATTTIQRTFVRAGRNLFDNFLFSTQPITEIHPGAPMYVDGTVYIGGDLYTATDDLHFLKDVSFTGKQTLNYKGTSSTDPLRDPRYGGTSPTINNGGVSDNWNANNPPHRGSEQKLLDTPRTSLEASYLDDPTSNDTDANGNPNDNGYHEIIEEKVSGNDDPLQIDNPSGTGTGVASERIAANADYRVYVDKDNNINVFKGNATTALSATDAERVAIVSAITTNTALKDVRDGDNVRLVTVDVATLRTGVTANTIKDTVGGNDGLVLYVADTSAPSATNPTGVSVSTVIKNSSTGATTSVTSSRSRGVRLINGGLLPNPGGNTGFTFASPNMVYIQGDYNTGKTGSSNPPSNTATSYTPPNDKPSPIVSGYNRATSAVVGDAVNILSNAWNDANSLTAKSTRVAANTTVNTCIVAGNVPTTASSYSGGIENFVRFHESWSGKYFTIYGSLAQLFASQQATRPWSAADYDPPNRRWYYDDKLQDSNPPGFHVARLYDRGRFLVR